MDFSAISFSAVLVLSRMLLAQLKDLVKFQLALGNIMRANMDGLRKRQRTPEERRAERAERKKKAKKDPPAEAAASQPKSSPKKEATKK